MKFKNGKLDLDCTNRNEYIIKDDVGITLGRVFLLDIDESNKNCIVKIKIYKKDRYSTILSTALEELIDKFFNEMKLFKIQLVVDEDVPIGTCRIFEGEKNGIYVLGRLAVKKEYRLKGIGSMLVKSATEYVKNIGGISLILHSQLRAKDFYLKLGFKEYGEIEYEAGCPHIWMKTEF